MADSDIIKEFLVAIGLKVDDAAIKKFDASVKKVTETVVKLGAALEAAAAATAVAVEQISSKFEDLYYASQRIGSSVENINAFGFAISQVGGTAQGARSALEGLASFMRSNPGGEAFIAGLGVSTRDVNGQMRDTKDILDQLAARFRQMPFYMAKVRASMLGIDENTLQAMIRGSDQFSAKYHEMAKRYGLDQQTMAAASHTFMTRVRDVQANISLMFTKIGVDLLNVVGPQLDRFADWFEKNGPEIGAKIEAIGKPVLALATLVASMAATVIGWLTQLDQATNGWSTAILAAAAAWQLLNLSFLATPEGAVIAGIAAAVIALIGLAEDIQTYFGGGKSLIDWGPTIGAINSVLAVFQPITDALKSMWAGVAKAFTEEWPKLQGALKDLFSALSSLWTSLKPILEAIGKALIEFAGQLITALGPSFLTLLKTSLDGITGLIHVLADAIRIVADVLGGHWAAAWNDAKKLALDAMHDIIDGTVGVVKAIKQMMDAGKAGSPKLPAPADAGPVQIPTPPHPGGPNANGAHTSGLASFWGGLTKGVGNWVSGAASSAQAPQASAQQRALAQQAMAYFQSQGWTKAQSAGISANLLAESGLKTDNVGDSGRAYGIGQWHPDRQAEFAQWSGHSIIGSTLKEQLAFVQFELTKGMRKAAGDSLRRMSSASAAGNIVSSEYESPLDIWGSKAAARGALADQLYASNSAVPRGSGATNVKIDQKTDIHVTGSDPKATAQATADAQDRVNGNLLRNAKGAMS